MANGTPKLSANRASHAGDPALRSRAQGWGDSGAAFKRWPYSAPEISRAQNRPLLYTTSEPPYIHTYILCMYVCMYVCMYECMYVYMYIYIYIYNLSLSIYIYIYTHTHMYICIYIYIYTHTYTPRSLRAWPARPRPPDGWAGRGPAAATCIPGGKPRSANIIIMIIMIIIIVIVLVLVIIVLVNILLILLIIVIVSIVSIVNIIEVIMIII